MNPQGYYPQWSSPTGNLGPLPPGWSEKMDPHGKLYFIDHNTKITTYQDPRLQRIQPPAPQPPTNPFDPTLPPGWERRKDPAGRVYFVDHKSKNTNWEDPRIPFSQGLPQGWEIRWEPSGRTYFVDHHNKRNVYEDPRLQNSNPFQHPSVQQNNILQQFDLQPPNFQVTTPNAQNRQTYPPNFQNPQGPYPPNPQGPYPSNMQSPQGSYPPNVQNPQGPYPPPNVQNPQGPSPSTAQNPQGSNVPNVQNPRGSNPPDIQSTYPPNLQYPNGPFPPNPQGPFPLNPQGPNSSNQSHPPDIQSMYPPNLQYPNGPYPSNIQISSFLEDPLNLPNDIGGSEPLQPIHVPLITVNGKKLTDIEIETLKVAFKNSQVKDGNYWYDPACGAWGTIGGPQETLILADLSIGGPLQSNASNGDTGIFINGRELHAIDAALFSTYLSINCERSRWWVNAEGNCGHEGDKIPMGNLFTAAKVVSGGGPWVPIADDANNNQGF